MPFTPAQFADFFNLTRASIATGPGYIANLAQKTNYPFFRLLRGKKPFEMAKGGSSIIDEIQISDAGQAADYNPGEAAVIQFVNTTRGISVPWNFGRSFQPWTDAEFNLHTAGGDKNQVKDYAKNLRQKSTTSHVNYLDRSLFARPSSATMESATPTTRTAYSLPALISEDTVRFRPPATQWTVNTIHGIDVTVDNFRNKVETYTAAQINDPIVGIIRALDKMAINLYFNGIPPEAGDSMQEAGPSDLLMFTNKDGFVTVQGLCRQFNDRLSKVSDPSVGEIGYDGIPFIHCPQLDTELLDQSTGASAAYTGNAYPNGFPRIFVVNKQNTAPVFMKNNIMSPKPVFQGTVNLPDVNVIWTFSTWNLMTNNRNRNGIIAPG